MHDAAHNVGTKPKLPKGYGLEAEGNNRLLKRPNGCLVAAFTEAVLLDSILLLAAADERYMRALERRERFSSEADSETVFLFAEDVKEAHSGFLMALEAVFRGWQRTPVVAVYSLCSARRETLVQRVRSFGTFMDCKHLANLEVSRK
jgi:hypothetical protein